MFKNCKSLIIYDTKLVFFLFSNVVNMSKYLLICFVWYCIYRKVPNVSILPTENKYYYIANVIIGILEYEISKSVLIIKKSRGYRILIITWRYQSWFMWYRSGFMFLMFQSNNAFSGPLRNQFLSSHHFGSNLGFF